MQKIENLANQDNNKKNNNVNGPKKILLVYGKLNTGGIKTLVLLWLKLQLFC